MNTNMTARARTRHRTTVCASARGARRQGKLEHQFSGADENKLSQLIERLK